MQERNKWLRILGIGLFLGFCLLLIFGVFAEELLVKGLSTFDNKIIAYISQFSTPFMTIIMKSLSFLGSSSFLIILALIIIYIIYTRLGYRRRSFIIVANLAGAFILNELLKYIFHRARPSLHQLVIAKGYSFPSGHSMVSFSFYGIIAYLIWNNIKTPLIRWGLSILLIFLAIAIGISRIYLGVHYPSDVIAGFAAGGVWLIACILSLEALDYRKKKTS